MKKSNLYLIPLFILFFSCSNYEHNKEIGNSIVEKIEIYKVKQGYLPNSLKDINQEEVINKVLFCYEKVDSTNYMVWFGTTVGEGVYYYSDSKQWENRLREMKKY